MFFPISLCGDLLKIFSDSRFICRILGGGNRCDSRADLTSCDVFFFMFLSVCLLGLFERKKILIAGSFVGSLEVETEVMGEEMRWINGGADDHRDSTG